MILIITNIGAKDLCQLRKSSPTPPSTSRVPLEPLKWTPTISPLKQITLTYFERKLKTEFVL
jgi:hypothetical protein